MVTNYPVKRNNSLVEKKRQIVFAGGVKRLWNHENIIDAISTIENINYCLCGGSTSSYLENLKKHFGWNKVQYLGVVSHEEVVEKLSESMIGVAVSSYRRNTFWKEGTLGNTKIFEEMQAGLAVVCTDFDLWKEIIEKNKCGICVNPNDVEEIRNAIEYLLNHPKECKEMGERGRNAVNSIYNWEQEKPKLLELYAAILLIILCAY